MSVRLRASLRRLRVAVSWRPEWPLGLVAACAWVVLLVLSLESHPAPSPAAPVAASAFTCPIAPATAAATSPYDDTSLAGMALMAVAMMTPASLPAARHVAFNSLRRRRSRALLLYEMGYLALFLGFSAAALFVATAHVPASTGRWAPVVVLTTAAAWQLSRWKRRIALGCRRTVPLPATGARADVACVRFGFLQASRCLGSTWPLMVLMIFAGPWHLLAMFALTAIMILEERPAAARRIVKPVAVVLLALAAAAALAG